MCGAAGLWAGRVATTPQSSIPSVASEITLAEVREASVGRTLPYGVTVTQRTKALARNAIPGVVVSVSPGELDQGDTAYVVAGVPVRVVVGNQPFYRPLTLGDRGVDVKQLEAALVKLDMLASADTTFDGSTAAAVRAWQRVLGIPRTGSVALGELVSVPNLPAAITVGKDVSPGAVLSGGEESVLTTVGDRVFALELSPDQVRQVPNDAQVQVTFKERVWSARIVDSVSDTESGATRLVLAGPDGGAVCASQCAELPSEPTVHVAGKVFVVPQVKGPAVPAAAVQSRPDGSTFVVREDGSAQDVKVKGAASGLVVVDGLTIGQRVRIGAGSEPSETDATGAAPLSPGP